MLFGLNLLHLLLVLGAAFCVRLALREIAGRAMSPSRLAALPLVALAMTFVFFLFFLSLRQPLWLFPGALLAMGLTKKGPEAISGCLKCSPSTRPSREVEPTG